MLAKDALKAMHEAMLMHQYELALEQALIAIAETKLAYNAIKYEMETRNAGHHRYNGPNQV